MMLFQSPRPVRGETHIRALVGVPFDISIHSPRAGRDAEAEEATQESQPGNFNPHAPCGARLNAVW